MDFDKKSKEAEGRQSRDSYLNYDFTPPEATTYPQKSWLEQIWIYLS